MLQQSRFIILFAAAAMTLLLSTAHVKGQNTMNESTLIHFVQNDAESAWTVINDDVMGGVSSSEFIITGEETGVFRGRVSLENNGGFASVRSRPRSYDLAGAEGLRLRVRGDGNRYQLRLRTDDAFDGVSYQCAFSTRRDEWITVDLPFGSFVPTFRGRRVASAPALDPSRIRQIGFLIADKQEGAFSLEIRTISAL